MPTPAAVRYFFGVLRGLLPAACRVLVLAVPVFALPVLAVPVLALPVFAVLVFAVLAVLVLVLGLAGVLTWAAAGCGASGSAEAVVDVATSFPTASAGAAA